MWEPRRLTTLWASTDSNKDSFTSLRELAVACITVLSQLISEMNEENHDKSQSGKPWAEKVVDDEE
jgi:hypothetical protein